MLHSVRLQGFRCFKLATYNIASSTVVITGNNGSGKTSLLEGLYYACYLRSFRTRTPRELVHDASDGFSVEVAGEGGEPWSFTVGFAQGKKRVKRNGATITSYQDILDYYRVICIAEQDINLISGAPEERRSFLDQSIMFLDNNYITLLRRYRAVLKQRNALLALPQFDKVSYDIWTDQLEQLSQEIRKHRMELLERLGKHVSTMLASYSKHPPCISFHYTSKKIPDRILEKERLYKRSLIGAHLDDYTTVFDKRSSRKFASRGQQKLVVFLMKIAQKQLFRQDAFFLIDDFMTDFDNIRTQELLETIHSLSSQVIFTAPHGSGANELLNATNSLHIDLSL